jgi:transcription termination factor NusA
MPPEEESPEQSELFTVMGIGQKIAERLISAGLVSVEDVASSTIETLASIPGIGEKTAAKLLHTVQMMSESSVNPQMSEVVEDGE